MQSRDIAIRASFTALVFIATAIIPPIPIAATGGYFNFGETAIYITAFLFGGMTAGFAGGVGSALADLYLGFGSFAPITFVVKGIEGMLVGFIGKKRDIRTRSIALLIGGVVLMSGYFLAETYLFGLPAALEELPFNFAQFLIGAIISISVVSTLEKKGIRLFNMD
jgi:uncharacterized membrane protein